MHVEAGSAEPFAWNQDDAVGASGIGLLQSFWFVKSDNLGKVSVGKQSQASDNTAILVDGSGSLVPANWVLFDNAGFNLRTAGGGTSSLAWGDLGYCHQIQAGIGGDCNGVPLNVVRYDSPSYGGFSVSASWGTDDMWDVAARYAGELGGFKLAAAAAYSESTNALADTSSSAAFGPFGLTIDSGGEQDTGYFQVGGYVEHVATGLFAYGAWGQENVDDTYASAATFSFLGVPFPPIALGNTTAALVPDDKPEHWYLKAGLRERWTPLGHTVIYGEYAERNNMISPQGISDTALATGQLVTGSEMRQWGVGAVQEIDAAAMSLWISYKHFEGEYDYVNIFGPGGGTVEFEDFDLVKAGALINF
jgi:hypothetical protein